jgi:hypothetical protein
LSINNKLALYRSLEDFISLTTTYIQKWEKLQEETLNLMDELWYYELSEEELKILQDERTLGQNYLFHAKMQKYKILFNK